MQLTVTGHREVSKRLRELGGKLARKVLRDALRSGAKLVLADAVANVSKDNSPKSEDTGTLRRSLRIRAGKRRRGQVTVKVATKDGWFQGKTFYGAFREFGHKIGKRKSNEDIGIRKGKKRSASDSAAIKRGNDSRAEVKPYPAVGDAYRNQGEAAATVIEREILAGIHREASR